MPTDSGWTPSVPEAVHVTRGNQESTAAGIYGVIVSSAVMSASHADSAGKVIAAVLITLMVYWGAERYARIVAERIHEGHRPNWSTVRHQLTHGWEIVTASTLPLLVLAGFTALGSELFTAVLAAPICSTALLCVAGWAVGRRGRLSTGERIVSAVVAASSVSSSSR